jgi:hypothetical protein
MTDPVKPVEPAKPAAPAKPVHNTVLPTDIDANGNVTLWDHGPRAPVSVDGKPLAKDDPRVVASEAEAKAWHDANGDNPVPVVMHNSDASHALAVDPARWSIEPDGVDAEVDAEVAKMKKAREDAKKAAEDRAAVIQLAEDRKAAIATVMANRAAKAAADKAEKLAAARASAAPAAPAVTYVDPPPPARGLPQDPPIGTTAL